MAQDPNDFAGLVPGYKPGTQPTRDQLIAAGVAQQKYLQDLRARGVVTDAKPSPTGGIAVPHAPDVHKFFGGLSDIPYLPVGGAAAITNAWAYHTEGKDKQAWGALAAGIPVFGKLGKGLKLFGDAEKVAAEGTKLTDKPADTAPPPAGPVNPPTRPPARSSNIQNR
jgi:hypothetical protein